MDYKKGASDPVDPTKQVGTYSVDSGNGGEIAYSYSGGPAYTYTVWGQTTSGTGTYDFCVGASPITIRVTAGTSGC